MSDALFTEKVLKFLSNEFNPFIRLEILHFLTSLGFKKLNKVTKFPSSLSFVVKEYIPSFSRMVINHS